MRNNLKIGAGVLIAVLLLWKGCGHPSTVTPSSKVDTVQLKSDTAYVLVPSMAGFIPDPQPVQVQRLSVPFAVHDTLRLDATPGLNAEAAEMIRDYYTRRFYDQSVTFGDTAVARSTFTVYNNKVEYFKTSLDSLRFPVITKTQYITRREQLPAKVRGFITFSAQGTEANPLRAAGVGFMLQGKRDHAIELSATYDRLLHEPLYQISIKRKISFHL